MVHSGHFMMLVLNGRTVLFDPYRGNSILFDVFIRIFKNSFASIEFKFIKRLRKKGKRSIDLSDVFTYLVGDIAFP